MELNLSANPTEVQRNAHREAKKKDCKALFYIHQCVDNKVFEKIGDVESSKEAWDHQCVPTNHNLKPLNYAY
ncbi:hypothetical protein MTR_7g034340 [Medicago truncatula]|uniref:Uncharacterized protein n=1 Tax=Medicago truncatula TaxID=3880 RepID=A0A072TXH7_MEDTR|nr:hypothetical protein MTR_7g034340 [Medicago truncatula]